MESIIPGTFSFFRFFADFSGIGIKTSFGMGGICRRESL
mgnify:CR=1 FL=1